MLGWWILVCKQTPEERDACSDRQQNVIAKWEASLGGDDWLRQLVEEGKAQKILHNGYPNRFVAKAQDVLPLFRDRVPQHDGIPVIGDDYVTPAGWVGSPIFDAEGIATCNPEQVLTIDAWDQS